MNVLRKQLGLRGATLALAGAIALAGTHAWATRDFARYEVILQTLPFGNVSATTAADAAAALPASQSFIRNLRLCALKESGAGIRVGFIDIAAKPPRNYLLYVGETSSDGVEVRDADFTEGKALLRKGADEQWIELGGAPAAGGGPGPGPGGMPARPSPSPARASVTPPAAANSYAARLRARQEALRTRTVEPPKLSGEALQKHLQDYNVQLIKEGKPPLPIALTPEQDTQLVQEGYLPPQDPQATAAPAAPAAPVPPAAETAE
jgi:hypothetical protein